MHRATALLILLAACAAPPEVAPVAMTAGPAPAILPMEDVLAAAGQPGPGTAGLEARAAALRARAAALRAE
jgi:hypothetical protein